MFNPDEIALGMIKKTARILQLLKKRNHEILVVTGGGNTARSYIDAGKKLGASKNELDNIGIEATKLNARLLISALGDDAEHDPSISFEKAIRSSLKNKIPVMGGTKPGHTTDAVAAELADSSNSELLIFVTDVEGLYTGDPKEDSEAKKISRISTKELAKLMSKMDFEPGMKAIIDPFAAEMIQKNRIRALVVGEKEIGRLPKILEGSSHTGTEILPPDEYEEE